MQVEGAATNFSICKGNWIQSGEFELRLQVLRRSLYVGSISCNRIPINFLHVQRGYA